MFGVMVPSAYFAFVFTKDTVMEDSEISVGFTNMLGQFVMKK